MEGGPPTFRQDFTCPALLEDRKGHYPYGAVTLSGRVFQTRSALSHSLFAGPTTPQGMPWGLGSPAFARHYSGSRGFFPFLRVLRCFSSPACLSLPYGFRQEYARITTRGFPHSEIPGSLVGQHLPRAYRSRPRPSSALGAKASTVCPFSLDSERTRFLAAMEFSRCTWTGRPREDTPDGRSLKTQQRERPRARARRLSLEIGRGRRCSRRAGVAGRLESHRRCRRLPE